MVNETEEINEAVTEEVVDEIPEEVGDQTPETDEELITEE